MLHATVLADGKRNLTLELKGIIESNFDLQKLFTVKLSSGEKLHLASAVWLLQEKMGLALWWSSESIMMTMESRNSVRFDNGLRPPKDWDGQLFVEAFNVDIAPLGPKRFLIHLEFDK